MCFRNANESLYDLFAIFCDRNKCIFILSFVIVICRIIRTVVGIYTGFREQMGLYYTGIVSLCTSDVILECLLNLRSYFSIVYSACRHCENVGMY